MFSFSFDPGTVIANKACAGNGQTSSVSVRESDEERAEERESRYRNGRGLNAGINE